MIRSVTMEIMMISTIVFRSVAARSRGISVTLRITAVSGFLLPFICTYDVVSF